MEIITKFILASAIYFTFAASLLGQQSSFSLVFEDINGSAQSSSIIKSFDLNYMIVGSRDNDGLLMKMDDEGNIIWDKRINFGNYQAVFSRIIGTTDSCFVITGNVDYNFVVIKTTVNGDTLWTKSIDLGYMDYPVSIQQTTDSGFILAGYSVQYDPSYFIKMDIVKLSPDGTVEWASQFSNGSNTCQAYSVKQMPDNGYIIAGKALNDPDYFNASLTRLNSSGAFLWSKVIETPLQGSERIYDVVVSDSTLICYAQITYNRNCIFKTDFNADVIWAKQMDLFTDATENYGQPMPSIHPTADGGFAFVSSGSFFGQGNLIKIDSMGSQNWAQFQELMTMDVIESNDNGFITIGNGPLLGVKVLQNNNPQIGIIKSDSLGNSTECAGQGWLLFDTISLAFYDESLSLTEVETLASPIHPVISNSNLSSRYGCVAFIGGVDETKAPLFSISPNPNNGSFQIHSKQQENLSFQKLTIYNLEGKVVFESENPELLQTEIKLPALPNGMYFAQLAFRENTYSVKFLIQN